MAQRWNKPLANKRIALVSLKKQLREIAKNHGVKKVIFSRNGKYIRGTFNAFTKTMFVCTKQTKKDLLITFFHELGHCVAVKENRWKKYHFNLVKYMEAEQVFYIENQIDRIGKKYWNKLVDVKQWGRYKYCYPKSNKTQLMKILSNIVKYD
jgi:Zn-dependent peptidase ImmA (M78 family)